MDETDNQELIPVTGRSQENRGALAQAAQAVSDAGRNGDDMLVHLNRKEFMELVQHFGQPTINPETNLPEFWLSELLSGLGAVGKVIGSLTSKNSSGSSPQSPTITSSIVTTPASSKSISAATPSVASTSESDKALINALALSALNKDDGQTDSQRRAARERDEAAAYARQAGPYQHQGLYEENFFRGGTVHTRGHGMGQNALTRRAPPVGQVNVVTPSALSAVGARGYSGPRPAAAIRNPALSQNFAGGGYSGAGKVGKDGAVYYVKGPDDGRADNVKANLSHGEYIIPADVVSALGNGNNESGATKLDEMRSVIRKHTSKGMDRGLQGPDARHPLEYLALSGGGK